jgi:putative MATE family efflux protein
VVSSKQSIKQRLLQIAAPAIIENFLQMLVGLVDAFLVAKISLDAVSGVALGTNVIAVFQAIFIALGAASASFVARSPQKTQRKRAVAQALKLTLFVSFTLSLIAICLARPIISLLGGRENVLILGTLYLFLVGGTIFLLALMTTLGNLLRIANKPRLPMYVGLLVNGLNVILSSFFIFICHFGVAGAAAGTIIARIIGNALLYYSLQKTQLNCPLRTVLKIKIDRQLINLAIPASAERVMMRVGDLIVIVLIIHFGADVFAGNAIGETITQFNYMPGFGIATATVVLTARSYGRGDKKEVKAYTHSALIITTLLMYLTSGIIYLVHLPLSMLFTQNKTALAASAIVALFSCIASLPNAGTLIYTAAFQGIGNAKLPFYATAFGMWVIRILLGLALGYGLGFGLVGVWLATTLDNTFRMLFLRWRFNQVI